MKWIIITILITTFFVLIPVVGAIPNPHSLEFVSISPQVECLEIDEDRRKINNICLEDIILKQNERRSFLIPGGTGTSLFKLFNSAEIINNKCAEGGLILENGMNFCDYDGKIDLYIEENNLDYIVLTKVSNILMLYGRKIIISAELRYSGLYGYEESVKNRRKTARVLSYISLLGFLGFLLVLIYRAVSRKKLSYIIIFSLFFIGFIALTLGRILTNLVG